MTENSSLQVDSMPKLLAWCDGRSMLFYIHLMNLVISRIDFVMKTVPQINTVLLSITVSIQWQFLGLSGLVSCPNISPVHFFSKVSGKGARSLIAGVSKPNKRCAMTKTSIAQNNNNISVLCTEETNKEYCMNNKPDP